MRVLGIDTSSQAASVAILENGCLRCEILVNHKLTHSETIVPMIEQQLQNLDLTVDQIDAFAVNIGPGSFTGVRIGVCTANALGYAGQKPVIGMDSLRVLYENVRSCQDPVCVMIDAKNDQVYAAQFHQGVCTHGPCVMHVREELCSLPTGALFIGDGAVAHRELIQSSVNNARFVPLHQNESRASALCHAAMLHMQNGEPLPVQAVPLYLRPSQAERLFEQKQGEQK